MTITPESILETADWSVWSLCAAGDYFMLPLLLLLLIVIYVFSERIYFIGRAARYNETLVQRIKDYIHENELESADNLCRQEGTPAARLLQTGLGLLGHPIADISTHMKLVAGMEVKKLRSITRWLPFTAAAAPLAGLLGSLLGLLRHVYEAHDIWSSPQELFTPLMTLVVGIIVGLTALCAWQYLLACLNRVKLTLTRVTESFLSILNEPSA